MNKPCPKCRAIGRDKKGDHLWLMEDGTTWCCNKPYHSPYYERDGTEQKELEERNKMLGVEDIKQLPILGNVDRKVSQPTHQRFKIRTECSTTNGEPVAFYYPETSKGKFIGYKCRKLPKQFYSVHLSGIEKATPDFSGQHCCPASGKRILITGGEEDMLAAYEMLSKKYPDNDHAVVSLPRGEETSVATVAENFEFLKGFEEVIIGTDMDEAGRKAVDKLAPLIGDRARVLVLSEKDISDMLVRGKIKEFINAYYNAKEYRPAAIFTVTDLLDRAIQPTPWGLSYPFDSLTMLTYGMKKTGEIIGIGASPGAGKSSLIRQIQTHLMFEHNEKIAVFDIEEKAEGALKHLIGGIMNKPIHRPDCDYSVTEAKEVGKSLEGKVEFYDGATENWDEVKDYVMYFASRGIRFFFIDPLSALVEHLNASDANQELGIILRDMRRFRKLHNLTFFHSNHLNNPTSGKDHGAGGDVYGSQFSGSRAQWKYSTALWGLTRNQLADTEEERNICKFSIIKDRLGGKTGAFHLKYNSATGKLEETTEGIF